MRYIIAVFLVVFAVPAWASVQAGLEAYERGEYTEAVRWYRQAADEGDPEAQYNLGVMYNFGRGVPQSDAQAMMWYREAAGQGIADAAFRLGFMYASGAGYPIWLHDQFYDEEAFDNAGRDVPQDDAEALKWHRIAAEQGHALAQYSLGVMYVDDKGVPRDDVQAHLWFNLAATLLQSRQDVSIDPSFQGVTLDKFPLLPFQLGGTVERMTPEQLAEARRLAREWMEMRGKAVVEGSLAHSIYTKIMESRHDYDDLTTNKKTLAACINWATAGKNYIDVPYTYVYYKSAFPERRIRLSELMRGAINGCDSGKKEHNLGCDCVAADWNGSPVLRVPKSVSGSTIATGLGDTAFWEPEPRADGAICRSALASRQGVPRWDDRKASRNSVAEAERRGLTPEECSALLE